MIIVDKTGRKLKPGEQMVDVFLAGMFQGQLVKIVDSPIAIPGQHSIPPHIVIAVTITPHILPSGMVQDVYIIGEINPAKDKSKLSLVTDPNETRH